MDKNKDGSVGSNVPIRRRPTMDMYAAAPKRPLAPPRYSPVAQTPVPGPKMVTAASESPPKKGDATPPLKPALAKPNPDKPKSAQADVERPSAKFILGLFAFLLLLVIGAGATYYFVKYRPAHKNVNAVAAKPQADKSNHIADDTLGVKFAISKDLTAIPNADLLKQNPYFIYGFKQADVAGVTCTISQQQRKKPGGAVAAEALRDGTLDGIKKAFTKVKLVDFQDTSLANGQDAADMTITYNDGKTDLKERMVVAATTKKVTFAFCSSPKSLYDFYGPKFNSFFDSLEIY